MDSPRISVIMPVYNGEDYLHESLASFLSQDINRAELICVDDGSTDDTYSILQAYQETNPEKIRIIQQENQGSAIARNNAIEFANGEYCYFLDVDDMIPFSTTLTTLYDLASENAVSIAGGSLLMFDENGSYTDFAGQPGLYGQQFLQDGIINYHEYQFDFGYQRFLYNRVMLIENNVRFPNFRRYQDPPFFVKAMVIADRFYATREITYKYRLRDNHIEWTAESICHLISAILEIASFAAKNDLPDLFNLSLLRLRSDYYHVIAESILGKRDSDVLRVYLHAEENIRTLSLELPSVSHVERYTPIEVRLHDELVELDNMKRGDPYIGLTYDEIVNSRSWKVGRAVTWLPRTMRNRKRNRK